MGIEIVKWQETIKNDWTLLFVAYKLKDSFYVWIGTNNNEFGAMSLAMKTPFDPIPATSVIVDGVVDNFSSAMAQHLAIRAKCPFYVTCSVPPQDPELQIIMEKSIIEHLIKPSQQQKTNTSTTTTSSNTTTITPTSTKTEST